MRPQTILVAIAVLSAGKLVYSQAKTKLHGGYLFERFDEEVANADRAVEQCTTRGAWLFEPKTNDLDSATTDLFDGAKSERYLMGLKYLDNQWRWSDYNLPTDTHWNSENEASQGADGQTCSGIEHSKWLSIHCNQPRRYVCQSYQDQPSETITYDGSLLERFDHSVSGYTAASDICSKREAWLIEIKDEAMDKAVLAWVNSNNYYLMGIKYSQAKKEWQYKDETPITYNKWNPGEGDDEDQDCACLKGGGWVDLTCGGKPMFICQSYLYCEFYTGGKGNPCKNGGTCNPDLVNPPFYTCICAINGHYGDTCEAQYCDFHNNPCKNGGTCNSKPGTGNSPFYTCTCANNGYYGDTCGAQYCDFFTNPCEHDGTCNSKPGNGNSPFYTCTCANNGYYGDTCGDEYCEHKNQKDICRNGGVCKSTPNTIPYYECNCTDTGYYGDNCGLDAIIIHSPRKGTAVAGEPFEINVNITTFDGELTVEIYKMGDDTNQIQNITGVGNETIIFVIEFDDKSQAGEYIFIAYPKSNAYRRNSTTVLDVHVKVNITRISPKSLFSPVTNGTSQVNCTAEGIPPPSRTSWYDKYQKEVALLSSSSGVYQINQSESAILFVSNALLTDDGQYTCQSINYVGESRREEIKTEQIILHVYGSPEIQSIQPTPCSKDGILSIEWNPNNQTMEVNHKFFVTQCNGSSVGDIPEQISIEGNEVIFTELQPYTNYKVEIKVCPDQCIDNLNVSENAVTGYGIPGPVREGEMTQDNQECIITWDWPDTPNDQIGEYEVTITRNYVYQTPNSELKEIIETYKISPPDLQYNLKTEPNQQYTATIRAFTCAGAGESSNAAKNCLTPSSAPDEINASKIAKLENGDPATMQITINMPDEKNGPVSCVFVIVNEGNRTTTSQIFTIDDLNRAESTKYEKQFGVDYLAIAIPRDEIGDNQTYNILLGDDTVDMECDLNLIWGETGRWRKRAAGDTEYMGKNWPLRTDGTKYGFYTVTSTPSDNGVIFSQKSPIVSFVNGTPPLGWIAAVVICPILIIVIIGATYYMWKRRRGTKKKSEDHPIDTFPSPTEDAPIYENVSIRSDTDIPFAMLQRVYRMLKADDNMQFREQYQEIKTKSRANAPPSTVGGSEEMMRKNRYKNILPYDSSRVSLKGHGFDGYINACYVNGYQKTFIATQGPLPHTVVDFWRMVVEQHCTVIVMLTRCVEAGKTKCEKYWPSLHQAAQQGLYVIRNDQEIYYGGFVQRTFVIETPQKKGITVQQYQFLKWPDHGVPTTTSSFFRLHKSVMETYDKTRRVAPLLVHCSAGVGRTGAFIGYDILRDQTKSKSSVDIFNCVMTMRKQRVDMVQTCDQYEMLHKLMLERYLFGETDVNREQFITNQQKGKGSPKRSNISKEFENLATADSLNPKVDDKNIPVLRNRVVIVRQPEDTEWISIDANYVEAYNKDAQIIAAQGPFNATVEYFWRAILDNNVDTVVMIGALDNKNQNEGVCYWPKSTREPLQLNNIQVDLQSESKPRGIFERKIVVTRKNQHPKIITQFQYPEWKPNSLPRDATGILDLLHLLQSDSKWEAGSATLVHCSDGLGRTGVFCALLNIIDRLKFENRIDVFRTIKDLRNSRPGMVQSLEQYNFCYEAVKTHLSSVNIYSNDALDAEEGSSSDPIYENL